MRTDIVVRIAIGLTILLLGITNPVNSKAADRWKTWEDLRWRGLVQFKSGQLSEAKSYFEKALNEAISLQPESENTAISAYDIAQVYDAEGDNRKTEQYCNQAMEIARKAAPHSGLRTLALLTLEDIRVGEHDHDQARRLDEEIIKMNKEDPKTQCIAQAEMRLNGEIEVKAYSEPHTYAITPSIDPKYRDLLMHIGPLRPEHPKPVIQWAEEENEH